MVVKLYGPAKFYIRNGLVEARMGLIMEDAHLRADEQENKRSDAAIRCAWNHREEMYLREAITVLGLAFGRKNFNWDDIDKTARERLARV